MLGAISNDSGSHEQRRWLEGGVDGKAEETGESRRLAGGVYGLDDGCWGPAAGCCCASVGAVVHRGRRAGAGSGFGRSGPAAGEESGHGQRLGSAARSTGLHTAMGAPMVVVKLGLGKGLC